MASSAMHVEFTCQKKHEPMCPLIRFVPIAPTSETDGVCKHSYLAMLGALTEGQVKCAVSRWRY